ncbi:MAG: EamA family transporter [Acutalibacteraceae bacterium]|nr:EamA family transporter [Acutalibacteraceae bacterium]
MGYLFVLISVLSGTTKGYCGKKTSEFMKNPVDGVFISMIRMIICTLIGGIVVLIGSNTSFGLNMSMFLTALMSAAATSCFVVSWLMCVKNGSYMMLDIFLMLGVIIPISASAIMFGEKIRINQVCGIMILAVAVYLLCGYNVRLKGKMTFKSVLLLVFCGAMNGFADLSQKMFVKLNENASAAVFNFYSYLFSFIILAVVFAVVNKKQSSKRKDMGKITGYILIMGICLFFNSYFKTLAAHYIDAARLYPLCQGLSLIFSSLMATFLLKEKLDFKGAVGIVIAFGALLIINLL